MGQDGVAMVNVNQVDESATRMTLLQLLAGGYGWFEAGLLAALRDVEGTEGLRAADLKLLANLDCDTTYASELARRLGISRQAVTKLLRNLVDHGFVRLEPAPGKRHAKQIVITASGRVLIGHAVTALARLEEELAVRVGSDDVATLRRVLAADWGEVPVVINGEEADERLRPEGDG